MGGQSEEARHGTGGTGSRNVMDSLDEGGQSHRNRSGPRPVMMTPVLREPGVATAPPRTVLALDGLCLPSEGPAAWPSVVPTSSDYGPQDSQAFLAMGVTSRVFRSTDEIEGGKG